MKWLFFFLWLILLFAYKGLKHETNKTIAELESKLETASNEVEIYKNKILSLEDNIKVYKDSIVSINEDLVVYKFKLERIKEYNTIAAKPNQLQFLRGWINRVIND